MKLVKVCGKTNRGKNKYYYNCARIYLWGKLWNCSGPAAHTGHRLVGQCDHAETSALQV